MKKSLFFLFALIFLATWIPKADAKVNISNITEGDFYDSFESDHFVYYIPYWVSESEEFSGGGSDANENAIADDFEGYAEDFEDTYTWYQDSYGLDLWWDGNNKLPVLFDDLGDGYYGYFTWDLDEYYYDSIVPHMVVNVYEQENAVVGTIAHEMFHAIQYGYVQDMSILMTSSFAEGSAAMIESKLPGNDDLSYMNLEEIAATSHPELSVFGALSDWNDSDQYGSFLWYSYLHQYQGKPIIKGILKAYATLESQYGFDESLEAYYSYLAVSMALEQGGVDVRDAYGEFAEKLYEKNSFTDSKFLPDVNILKTHTANSDDASIDDDAPAVFGSNYIKIQTKDDEGYLAVQFEGNTDAFYYLSFLPEGRDGSVDRAAVEGYYVDFGQDGTVYIPLDGYKDVIMVVSPVDATEADEETQDFFNDYVYPYSYSYEILSEVPEESELTEADNGEENSFSDVDSSDKNATAIEYLKDNGIISGYSDGTFKPENALNRAELLKILVEGLGVTPDATEYANCFPDVTTDWYAKYVCYAKAKGWIEGYPDGNFKSASEVNKVEALKMLLEVFDVEVDASSPSPYSDVSTSDWYAKYVVKAYALDLLEELETYQPGESITRGGVSENIYRLLHQL